MGMSVCFFNDDVNRYSNNYVNHAFCLSTWLQKVLILKKHLQFSSEDTAEIPHQQLLPSKNETFMISIKHYRRIFMEIIATTYIYIQTIIHIHKITYNNTQISNYIQYKMTINTFLLKVYYAPHTNYHFILTSLKYQNDG